jgi:hypothetical protein
VGVSAGVPSAGGGVMTTAGVPSGAGMAGPAPVGAVNPLLNTLRGFQSTGSLNPEQNLAAKTRANTFMQSSPELQRLGLSGGSLGNAIRTLEGMQAKGEKTQQVVQNQGLVNAAAKAGIPYAQDLLGEIGEKERPLAAAAIMDFEADKARTDQLNEKNKLIGEAVARGGDKYRSALDEEKMKLADTPPGLEGAKESAQAHLDRIWGLKDELYDKAQQTWDRVNAAYDDKTAEAIDAGAQSMINDYDMRIGRAQALANEGNPEARAEVVRLEAEKRRAIGQVLSQTKAFFAEMQTSMDTTMAGLTMGAAEAGATMASYASQLVTQLAGDVWPKMEQQWLLSQTQTNMAIEQLKMNNRLEIANFLQTQPVYSVNLGGLTAILAELTELSREEAEQDDRRMSFSIGPRGGTPASVAAEPAKAAKASKGKSPEAGNQQEGVKRLVMGKDKNYYTRTWAPTGEYLGSAPYER